MAYASIMAAVGVVAAQKEIARAAKEASQLVTCTSLLHLAIQPSSDFSFAEAFALLWCPPNGKVRQNDDSKARLYAAHLMDLLLAGRIQLCSRNSSTNTGGSQTDALDETLFLLVASSKPVSTTSPSTSSLLHHMNAIQESRYKKGMNPIGLLEFIS